MKQNLKNEINRWENCTNRCWLLRTGYSFLFWTMLCDCDPILTGLCETVEHHLWNVNLENIYKNCLQKTLLKSLHKKNTICMYWHFLTHQTLANPHRLHWQYKRCFLFIHFQLNWTALKHWHALIIIEQMCLNKPWNSILRINIRIFYIRYILGKVKLWDHIFAILLIPILAVAPRHACGWKGADF